MLVGCQKHYNFVNIENTLYICAHIDWGMKRVILIIVIIAVLIISACASEDPSDQPAIDLQGGDVSSDSGSGDTADSDYIPKHREIKFSDIIDMIVYEGDLYFMRTDESKGAVGPTIQRYIDEKTPPVAVLEYDWTKYPDRLDDLYSLAEYNGELYAAGPMGLFKLDKEEDKFKEIEYSYGFEYNKEHRVNIGRMKTVQGKLYALLNYAPVEYTTGMNLAVLEGDTWKIADDGNSGIRHVEEYNGELYGSDGRLLRLGLNAEGKQSWQEVAVPEDEYGNSLLGANLKSYNGRLYACGEMLHSTGSISADGSASWVEETSLGFSMQNLEYPEWERRKHCTFIDSSRGKLFVGTEEFSLLTPSMYEEQKQYNPEIKPPKPELVESLLVYNGKEWKSIKFPGLSDGQAVTAVRALEEFRGKTYIAVETRYDSKFKTQPSFYILDDDGSLTQVTWWSKVEE